MKNFAFLMLGAVVCEKMKWFGSKSGHILAQRLFFVFFIGKQAFWKNRKLGMGGYVIGQK